MDTSKVFTDIVDQTPSMELLNQMKLIKTARKHQIARDIVDAVNRGEKYQIKEALSIGDIRSFMSRIPVKATLSSAWNKVPGKDKLTAGWNWAKANPWKASVVAGTAGGTATTLGGLIGRGLSQGKNTWKNDPVFKALSNPSKMTKGQWINTGVGAGAALAGGAGIYALLSQIPGIRRKPLIKAIMAMTGAGVLGYTGWRASDNYQKG